MFVQGYRIAAAVVVSGLQGSSAVKACHKPHTVLPGDCVLWGLLVGTATAAAHVWD
jgi:hypothetical protein